MHFTDFDFSCRMSQNTHSDTIKNLHFTSSISTFRDALDQKNAIRNLQLASLFSSYHHPSDLERKFYNLQHACMSNFSSHLRIFIFPAFLTFMHSFVIHLTLNTPSKTFIFASSISTFRNKFDFSQIRDQNQKPSICKKASQFL